MDCPILHIGLPGFSPLDYYRLGQCIAQAVEAKLLSYEGVTGERYGAATFTVTGPDEGRWGLLLPDLEGVDTVVRQIDIARQKGGISSREKYTLERFEVVRHT